MKRPGISETVEFFVCFFFVYMRVFVNAIVRIKHIMCRKEILHCSYCAIQNRSSNSNDSSKQNVQTSLLITALLQAFILK